MSLVLHNQCDPLMQVCEIEKKKCTRKKREAIVLGFTTFWLSSIMRKFCWGFFPMRVPQDKYFVLLCDYTWCSFSDPTIFNCFRILSKE